MRARDLLSCWVWLHWDAVSAHGEQQWIQCKFYDFSVDRDFDLTAPVRMHVVLNTVFSGFSQLSVDLVWAWMKKWGCESRNVVQTEQWKIVWMLDWGIVYMQRGSCRCVFTCMLSHWSTDWIFIMQSCFPAHSIWWFWNVVQNELDSTSDGGTCGFDFENGNQSTFCAVQPVWN